ncbi:MAG TPA: alpha/beta hydrolase [Baekduia sp.]|nr:alpha/beta hydrolase [Baekduia sp.]
MAERTEDLDGQPVHWREDDHDGIPTVYLHGVPNSAEIWAPFIARTGGLAVDLPGFGRSGKRADLAYDIRFYDAWLERFMDWRELETINLVVHDWGAVGLVWAQRFPDRVNKLVVIDAVPLLPGYKAPAHVKALRTPVVGELLVGAMSSRLIKLLLRGANVDKLPAEFFTSLLRDFDQGTQRAILKLYRSVRPGTLETAGRNLLQIEAPALVVWGAADPYLPAGLAISYANALGGETEIEVFDRAGHWPWADRPEVIDRVATFLA